MKFHQDPAIPLASAVPVPLRRTGRPNAARAGTDTTRDGGVESTARNVWFASTKLPLVSSTWTVTRWIPTAVIGTVARYVDPPR